MEQPKSQQKTRFHFIDVVRAWAILMMLQGHFIAALLSDDFKNNGTLWYSIWDYFRGVTAPVFFTVSGFVFTFILMKNNTLGLKNPRVKKGLKRGTQLIGIGYLLQLKFSGLFQGTINSSFDMVHVLQCIGLSIILIIALYLLLYKAGKNIFPSTLLLISLFLLLSIVDFEKWDYSFIPDALSNYFTTVNGSQFTIVPWFGYVAFGAFLATVFVRHYLKKNFYKYAIMGLVVSGAFLIFSSYSFLNNHFLARLGDVLFVFAFFMLVRSLLKNELISKIGQNTLSLYVVHSVMLYGSISGYGLTRFYYHSMTPFWAVLFGILFVVSVCVIVLVFEQKLRMLWNTFKRRYLPQ